MIPMCWKCQNAIIVNEINDNMLFDPGTKVLTGCKECDIIKSYEDATQYCPLLEKSDVQS